MSCGMSLDRRVKLASSKEDAEIGALARARLDDGRCSKIQGIYIYVKVKNELGIDGNDGVQGALTLLKHISQDECQARSVISPTLFQVPKSLCQIDGRFNYEGRKSDNDRHSLFGANFDGKPVLVKFCETYHERAHRILADGGFSPKLHFCAEISGQVLMVVMDLFEGRDAHHQFVDKDLPPGVIGRVKLAVDKLHGAGLVFGDLRRPNITIITKDSSAAESETDMGFGATLVDFDCRLGRTIRRDIRRFLTIRDKSWTDGVAPPAIMKQQHDRDMLDLLKLIAFNVDETDA
ncbi:hypothetical protein EWM64_g7885 [Hericium alpestre]|uniref:Protein kinase domain-containing protein n=1 Tax=Hericium alpestre TaxID=135208 RepID=A0A4Y9ZPE7_9AGAM|nr:hypothetical protein EWM64_g7885 [Hericium alpestre]